MLAALSQPLFNNSGFLPATSPYVHCPTYHGSTTPFISTYDPASFGSPPFMPMPFGTRCRRSALAGMLIVCHAL